MALQAKHTVEEINGTRATVVEKNIDRERLQFLKALLEHNGFETVVGETPATEEVPASFTLGVTDLVFNPVVAVYQKSLNTPEGEPVSPGYWLGTSRFNSDQYWLSDEAILRGEHAWCG